LEIYVFSVIIYCPNLASYKDLWNSATVYLSSSSYFLMLNFSSLKLRERVWFCCESLGGKSWYEEICCWELDI